MPDVVIINTSPLFYLHRTGLLHLLEKLYSEITIPGAVVSELYEGGKKGDDVPLIENYEWIRVENIAIPSFIQIIPDLGKGEAEVIALGIDNANPLLVLDDALARKIAMLNNFTITGTVGILLKAKEKNYIPEIKPVLEELKKCGFYITEKLVADILKIANEG
ncbi:MAG: DUF3368 domain-containing protein [bacterium]|nr:DUF3368 domain-containing protein [bacterium]